MDETQISITINPRFIERLIYWIVILALVILLLVVWMKSDTCDTNSTAKVTTTQTQQTTPPPAVTPPPESAPAATCTDAKKNQDETDVDCGGSCDVKCAQGKACGTNSDCISNICSNSICVTTAPQTLSGSLTLTLDAISAKPNPGNGTYHTYKVTDVSYTIKNGLSTDITPHVKVFIKDKSGATCLNEYTVDDAMNCAKAYAEFDLPKIASGKTLSDTTEITGTYVTQTVGNSYDPADPAKNSFKVVMYLFDENGDPIGGKTVSAGYTFNP